MRQFVACLVLVISLLSPVASAQQPRPLVYGQAFSIPSEVMGEDRPLVVSLPNGYGASNNTYPVMYLLDGPGNLQHTASTIQFLSRNGFMPPMIVVGIGNTDRTRDLTPPLSDAADQFPSAGGADKFLDFIETELAPWVESQFRTSPYRMLVGHSFGGLCAVHAMFAKPDLFNSYVSISPSLWWNDQSLAATAQEFFTERKSFDKSLYITLGNEGGNMQTAYEEFLKVLDTYASDDFEFDHRLMPDETHGTVPLRSTYQALRMIFDGWNFPQQLFADADLEGIVAHAKSLSEKFNFEVKVPENVINNLGYAVMGQGQIDKAIEILSYNLEQYPGSANVYDSLGEALEASGDFESAQGRYEEAIRRGGEAGDPNLGVYRQHLDNVTTKLGNIS